MTGAYAQYPYVGDDPAGVESAMTDLRGVGGVLGSLAGEVEHDTQSIVSGRHRPRLRPSPGPGHRRDHRLRRDVEPAGSSGIGDAGVYGKMLQV
jgi:hypothetical protein